EHGAWGATGRRLTPRLGASRPRNPPARVRTPVVSRPRRRPSRRPRPPPAATAVAGPAVRALRSHARRCRSGPRWLLRRGVLLRARRGRRRVSLRPFLQPPVLLRADRMADGRGPRRGVLRRGIVLRQRTRV